MDSDAFTRILVAFGGILIMIACSWAMASITVRVVLPWRNRRRWRRRLKGAFIVKTHKTISALQYPQDAMLFHKLNSDINIWCTNHLHGRYGCVPFFDLKSIDSYLSFKPDVGDRAFFFEKEEDALLFKMRWC